MLNSNSGVKTACLASLVKTFNVIYLIQCRLCNLQYIGETKRRLKDRFNEHLYSTLLAITSILQPQNTF